MNLPIVRHSLYLSKNYRRTTVQHLPKVLNKLVGGRVPVYTLQVKKR